MQLAINFSPQAEDLLAQGEIEIDLWKCPDWGDVVGRATTTRPIYVHFPFDLGHPDFSPDGFDEAERWLEETGTPYVNVHLNAERIHFPDVRNERQAVKDRFLKNLDLVASRFRPERVIAENVVCREPDGRYLWPSIEPDLITEVIQESGCGFLLDVAHATITCAYTKNPVQDYIEALPMNHLKELHVTGVQHKDFLRDSMPMTPEDWQTVEWLMPKLGYTWPRPWLIALEYGGVGPIFEWRSEGAEIKSQVNRLRSLMKP